MRMPQPYLFPQRCCAIFLQDLFPVCPTGDRNAWSPTSSYREREFPAAHNRPKADDTVAGIDKFFRIARVDGGKNGKRTASVRRLAEAKNFLHSSIPLSSSEHTFSAARTNACMESSRITASPPSSAIRLPFPRQDVQTVRVRNLCCQRERKARARPSRAIQLHAFLRPLSEQDENDLCLLCKALCRFPQKCSFARSRRGDEQRPLPLPQGESTPAARTRKFSTP